MGKASCCSSLKADGTKVTMLLVEPCLSGSKFERWIKECGVTHPLPLGGSSLILGAVGKDLVCSIKSFCSLTLFPSLFLVKLTVHADKWKWKEEK